MLTSATICAARAVRAMREAAALATLHLLLFALVHEPIVELLPHELLR